VTKMPPIMARTAKAQASVNPLRGCAVREKERIAAVHAIPASTVRRRAAWQKGRNRHMAHATAHQSPSQEQRKLAHGKCEHEPGLAQHAAPLDQRKICGQIHDQGATRHQVSSL
jgi:hypothetical protein